MWKRERIVGASVAVIMTCYNEGQYIGDAVRSVLDQTWASRIKEIVIADDGSQEETLTVLREIEGWDSRITIIYGKGGVGLPGQRCRAIEMTQAPIIAILDGDDIWVPEKLERQLPIIESNQDCGIVYSDFFTFPEKDISVARRAGVLDISGAANASVTYFLNDPPIIPSTILIRRAAYEASGGFNPEVRIFEDTDFYLRIAKMVGFALVNEPLLYKRNRVSSITGGRNDLMAHHAFVALKAAADNPELLPLVPRRLAERARKLGNSKLLLNDRQGAVELLSLAVRFDPLNWRAWTSLVAAKLFPVLALRMLGKERQAALGVG
jgi:glycosyltransferase involved in cell wall biosynthesis